jgi:hypothetical protein
MVGTREKREGVVAADQEGIVKEFIIVRISTSACKSSWWSSFLPIGEN